MPPTRKQEIKICQWNSRSLEKNRASLRNYLNENCVDVVVLSETWQKDKRPIKIPGFNSIYLNRFDGYGGVAIFVSVNYTFEQVTFNFPFQHIEICGVKLLEPDVTIVSIYKPPDKSATRTEWSSILSSFRSRTFIGGDFNAHHQLWGRVKNDRQGNLLAEAIEQENIIVLNDGSPTRISKPKQPPSAVDVSLVTPDLVSVTSWNVSDDTLGSDHYPIAIVLTISHSTGKIIPTSLYKENTADWSLYQTYISNKLLVNCTDSLTNVEKFESLTRIISDSASQAMNIKRPFVPKMRNPIWWDEECANIVRLRKEALFNYKRTSNLDNFNVYKCLDAQAKRLFLLKSRENWRGFLSKLNKNTPPTQIWNYLKKITNPLFKSNRQMLSQSLVEEVLDRLAPPFVLFDPPTHRRGNNIRCPVFDRPFTFLELEKAFKNSPSTAPGKDNYTNRMLFMLPSEAKQLLLTIFNDWKISGNISSSLKEIIICLILKPHKDKNIPESYRPISLMPCLLKLLERLIKSRLDWFLEHNSLLPPFQYGFRRGSGTSEALAHIVTNIQCAFSSNSYVACFFFRHERSI